MKLGCSQLIVNIKCFQAESLGMNEREKDLWLSCDGASITQLGKAPGQRTRDLWLKSHLGHKFSLNICHLYVGQCTIISYLIHKISSTRVQHKVGSRDEMRWSPYIVGQWIARVPADHACRTTQGRMKWNEMDEMSVEKLWNEICGRGKGRNPEKNLPRARFVHHETHMEWPRRELGTPVVGGERLTACATGPPLFNSYLR